MDKFLARDIASAVYKILKLHGYSDAGASWVAGSAGEAAAEAHKEDQKCNPFKTAPVGCQTAPSYRRIAGSDMWCLGYRDAPGAVYLG